MGTEGPRIRVRVLYPTGIAMPYLIITVPFRGRPSRRACTIPEGPAAPARKSDTRVAA